MRIATRVMSYSICLLFNFDMIEDPDTALCRCVALQPHFEFLSTVCASMLLTLLGERAGSEILTLQ